MDRFKIFCIMNGFVYLSNVVTLELDSAKCKGCMMCTIVCPHEVFSIVHKKSVIVNRDLCMECGACATNCPVHAISVTPGVGCAAYIIQTWIRGKEAATCGGGACC